MTEEMERFKESEEKAAVQLGEAHHIQTGHVLPEARSTKPQMVILSRP
jgi:hypothetical protein